MSRDLINAILVYLCLVAILILPWVVLRFLPRSFSNKPRVRAITVLLTFSYYMMLVEAVQPRFYPGPRLTTLDLVVMCTIPVAAFMAGRFAPHFSHTFTFGAFCGSACLYPFNADSFGLGWQIFEGHTSVNRLIAQWILITIAAGLGCWLIALLPPRKRTVLWPPSRPPKLLL